MGSADRLHHEHVLIPRATHALWSIKTHARLERAAHIIHRG
jgi:hypothetical protein